MTVPTATARVVVVVVDATTMVMFAYMIRVFIAVNNMSSSSTHHQLPLIEYLWAKTRCGIKT